MNQKETLSVSQAVNIAKNTVAQLPQMIIVGEVSGFRGPNAVSGHCYFELKDENSSVKVNVWKYIYRSLGVQLKDGLQIQITGSFDIYAAHGSLSFIASKITLAGEGLLRQQVDMLARKLKAEGLMEESRKRPIPGFCERVAVCTSLSGSVIDDVKRTLRRRNPLVKILTSGCQVQGDGAPDSIIAALKIAASYKPDCILLVRGGGSYEDLMTFNDEALARFVADCPVPVVTGIGHEPDTTICDLVSDRRTSTPTHAAESVAPALSEVIDLINQRKHRLSSAMDSVVTSKLDYTDVVFDRLSFGMKTQLNNIKAYLDALASRKCLQDPTGFLEMRAVTLLHTEERFLSAWDVTLANFIHTEQNLEHRLNTLSKTFLKPYVQHIRHSASVLEALSPLKVLSRGYALVTTDEGHVVKSTSDLELGSTISVKLSEGEVQACVSGIKH